MINEKKLKPAFDGANTRKPLDHLDAFYGNMAWMMSDAVELLQKQPLIGEHALPAHVLAENIIGSLHTFDMGGVNADVAAIKKLDGFKKLMHACGEKDVHVDMTHAGAHMHVGIDPSQPFKSSRVLIKLVELPPGQHPVLTR